MTADVVDLVDQLLRAIEANRDEINASRIAQGECGRVEILVNPKVRSVRVIMLLEDQRA